MYNKENIEYALKEYFTHKYIDDAATDIIIPNINVRNHVITLKIYLGHAEDKMYELRSLFNSYQMKALDNDYSKVDYLADKIYTFIEEINNYPIFFEGPSFEKKCIPNDTLELVVYYVPVDEVRIDYAYYPVKLSLYGAHKQ